MFGENVFDAYSYSRPVAYKSYYTRESKPYILNDNFDKETEMIKDLLAKNRQSFDPKEGLTRGLHWNGYKLGKRRFDHNSHETEYFIHQWKATNDLTLEHPTGTRQVYHNFGDFFRAVEKLVVTPPSLL
jgi:hypothetical protein